jgi:(1->4)-alpha-D-glucan 1-alpha-D-glucosylmutase
MPITLDTETEQQIEPSKPELIETIFSRARIRLEERRHIPTATYRLQFNRFFTFRDANEQIEYFNRLGISDIYASPFFKARPESLHGYDIANHNELNPSIGSEEDYNAMVEGLRRHGMCLVLDTVPNHMGIGEEGNVWWIDVLENGRASVHAPYFDIDWEPINPKLTNKVLLPVLGEQYGTVLENGELKVRFVPEEGRFLLAYYENTFPIEPRSYAAILDIDREGLVDELGAESDAALEYQSILTALNHLPPHDTEAPGEVQERNREKEVIKRRLAALCVSQPRACEHIERNVAAINGTPGDPHSFDRLDALLERQPYRLSSWRVATEEINYRRFFDVNDLAAVNVDQPAVFAEMHRMIMRFLREGKLHGLRIDHVDGLRDPAGYFADLQRAYFLEISRQAMDEMGDALEGVDRAALEAGLLERFEKSRGADPQGTLSKPLYVVVEKILARGESLPGDWAVHGTTGYEFTNAVNGLFVDNSNQKAFDETYHHFIGEAVRFSELVYQSKKQIMWLSLSSEVNVLTSMLNDITQSDRHSRDFTLYSIRNAIREVIACFPVYRTYITPRHAEVDPRDRAHIETAIARARKRNPAEDPSIFNFIRSILLLEGYDQLSEEERAARFNFVMKFQQVTGPVIAKGLEDTAFYVYNRLISLNEVGGEPEYFGISPAAFHKQQVERQRTWPASLLTTSTHDTKRSEDVRARISVLSEMPKEWRAAVSRWARMNRKFKRSVDGQLAPSPNEEYFLYQTLVGVWPFETRSRLKVQSSTSEAGATLSLEPETLSSLTQRLQAYIRKAMNEAKVNTSWINPNEPYQQAVADFIAAILKPSEQNRFLPDMIAFQQRVAHYGAFNSLSQVLLKVAGPGVPDIYQGNEIWDFSLVDPDNRRPVDYRIRRRLLDRVDKVKSARGAAGLVEAKEDGRIKLLVTSRALRFRSGNRALFEQGTYTPLDARGPQADSVVAFARSHEEKMAVVVTPRLMTRLGTNAGDRRHASPLQTPVGQVWSGAWLALPGVPAGERFHNVFTGEIIEAREQGNTVGLPLEEVLALFPVALLEKVQPGPGGETNAERGIRNSL